MSSDLKAEAGIELETSSLQKGSKEVQKQFKDMDKSTTRSLENIDESIEDVGNEATKTGDKIKSASQKGESAMDSLGDAVNETEKDMAAASIQAIGLAQGFGAVSDSAFGMQEKMVTIQRSEFGLSRTTRDLNREIEDFQIAVAAGELTGLAYSRAIEDITMNLRDMKIEEEEVRTEQESLNSEFINMGLAIGQTAALSILTLKPLLENLTKAQIRNKFATIANSSALRALGFNFKAAGIAMKGATISLAGFRMGLKATWLALGPIGIAIIAATAAYEIFATNAFGATDAVLALWDSIKILFPVLQALENILTNLFPDAQADVENYTTSIEELTTQFEAGEISAEEFATQLQFLKDTTIESTESLTAYDLILGKTNESTNDLNESTIAASSTMKGVPEHYRKMTSELDSYNRKLKEGTRVGDEWIRMQQEASKNRFLDNDVLGGINPNSSDSSRSTHLSLSEQVFADAIRRDPDFVPSSNNSLNSISKKNRQHGASAFFRGDRRRRNNADKFNDLFQKSRGDQSLLDAIRNTGINFSRDEITGIIGSRRGRFTLDGARRAVLNAALSERDTLNTISSNTNLSFDAVQKIYETQQGREDLANIEDFRRRELASMGIEFT